MNIRTHFLSDTTKGLRRNFLLIVIVVCSLLAYGCGSATYGGKTKRQWKTLLNDKDSRTRVQALTELGNMKAGAKDFENIILDIVNNKSELTDVRVAAILALGKIGNATGTIYPDILGLSLTGYEENLDPAIQKAAASTMRTR